MLKLFAEADLEQKITQLGSKTVVIAALVLIICTLIAIVSKDRLEKNKRLKLPLFVVMAGTIIVSTLLLFGTTIYLNTKSESKGPVHWHTDVEFWACGAELDLQDPKGALSNKIGTATYHEHNDKRIHLEGVVVRKSEDASLDKFMRVTGGYITKDRIGIPVNQDQSSWLVGQDKQDGDKQNTSNPSLLEPFLSQSKDGSLLEFKKGQTCGTETAEVQAFLYRFDKASNTYSQTKLPDPAEYVLRDESVVPPGDCLIVEFDVSKAKTDKLCQQYGVRDADRCTEFGVENYNPEICNIRQVTQAGEF
jgi:hypothetical protein